MPEYLAGLFDQSLCKMSELKKTTKLTTAVQSTSYGQIFRATSYTGGAALTNIVLGILRTKVMATLLGATGIGLFGVYGSITGLASTLAGMGIGNSGVRQIADAVAAGDEARIARTVLTLRRASWVTGLVGGLLLTGLSLPLSIVTFNDRTHWMQIAVLGFTIVIGSVSSAQSALIQGLRRMEDLARLSVIGGVAGTIVGLPLIWILGIEGIVPLMTVLALVGLLSSWSVSRKSVLVKVPVTWGESLTESKALLGLGFAFMISSLIAVVVAYLTRLIIVRRFGIEAAGHYGAAYSLAGIYAGFILSAMAADFYPRLTASARNHAAMNQLVNEQAEVALLLAVPGIMATLVMCPVVIHVFYAGGFDAAVPVLQWQVLGVLGRVVCWPIGFILLAKGDGRLFILTEVLAGLVHMFLIWILVPKYGISGAGMAFLGLYLYLLIFLVFTCRRLIGFHWTQGYQRLLIWTVPVVALTFYCSFGSSSWYNRLLGCGATGVVSWLCLRGLLFRLPKNQLARLGFLGRGLWRMSFLRCSA